MGFFRIFFAVQGIILTCLTSLIALYIELIPSSMYRACKLNRIYNSSFSGSVLWDLTSKNVMMLLNSWSVSIRHMWGLPLSTHRYLIEPLGGTHAKTMIHSRFLKFIQSIKKNKKLAPYYLLEKIKDDVNTITGKNIKYVLGNNSKDVFKTNVENFKMNQVFCQLDEKHAWRVGFVKEITSLMMEVN